MGLAVLNSMVSDFSHINCEIQENIRAVKTAFDNLVRTACGKVLVVDDDETLIENIEMAINGDRRPRFDIVKASDPEKIESILKNNEIKLAIVDYFLGYENCHRTCQRLKEKNIPVFVMSGDDSPEIWRYCAENGFKKFTKPLCFMILHNEIGRALTQSAKSSFTG